ncbi:MAG: serine/threonine-protein kinase [Pirellulales bacterium]
MALEQLGPYRLERVLGQGGMGTVYAGTDQRNGQQAAVKVLSTVLGDRPALRARFESEIETLKQLRHPHIVQMLGYGEQEGHLFYAMELVDGRSLQDELKEGRPFSILEVIRFGVEIAAALKLAHDSGIIHRDIKPANLMLTRDGHVKLTDFGIAKQFGASQLTADGGVVGTVDYMPPEQADGKPVTARSDLYSVGGVLYALVARRPPFTGRSLPQIIHALKFDTPVPLRRLAPDVPEELERIVHQLLEKEPAQRIATALILGNRLKALEHSLSAPPATSHEQEYDLATDVGLAADLSRATDVTSLPSGSSSGAAPQTSAFDMTWDSSGSHAAPPPLIDRSSPTQIDPADAQLASATSRFTTVAEDERRRRRIQQDEQRAERSFTIIKSVVGGLAVIILVGGAFLLSRPPAADPLYRTIAEAAANGDAESLLAVEGNIDQFLETYPQDPRQPEVAQFKQQLQQSLEQRRFDRRLRRPDDAAAMGTIERLYAEAMQRVAVEPERTLLLLQSLVDVFADPAPEDDRSRKTLELARHQIERLTPIVQRQRTGDLALARQQLLWADQQRADHPEAAERVYRGLETLLADKPWAADLLSEVRQRRAP